MQTAVEWFANQLGIKNGTMIEQAKEMERLQIIDAQSYAISNADMTNNRGYFDCDKYYNETYGSKGSGGVVSINNDKKFTEEDMRKAIFMAREDEHKIDVRHPNEIISSLTQPKDTSVMLVCEDCGMEECQCELETLAEKEYPYDELVDTEIKGFIVSAERSAWIEGVKYGQIIRPTSSQTEISDEEIKKAAHEHGYEHHSFFTAATSNQKKLSWITACKWYREQLKQRQ